MSAYGALLKRVLLPAYDALRGRPTNEILAGLERSQWLPADVLEAKQWDALYALLRHAHAHVPYYRQRFEEIGAHPGDLRSLEDFRRLPLLTREAARETTEQRTSIAGPRPSVRKVTGGSTGQPLLFGYDVASEYWRQAVRLRAYRWAGYQLGDRALHYWGEPSDPRPPAFKRAKVAVDRFLKRETYVDCTGRSDAALKRVVERIRRIRPDCLVVFGQAGGDLARFVNAHGLRDWGTIPVICGAERLMDADRRAMQEAFGPAVFETWGCREVMLIAAECEMYDGMHIPTENLLVEVLVDGQPAKPGENGEVAITDLHNLGMPLIRYVNGDLAVQGTQQPCACGRTLPRIGAVEGRITETLTDGEGERVSGLVFNAMFAAVLATAVRQFQVIQHRDRSLTLRIIPMDSMNESVLDQIRRSCSRHLKGITVRVELVSDIPLTRSGKRQVVMVEK